MSTYNAGITIAFDRGRGSKHDRIIDAVKRRWKLSRDKMSERYKIWEDAEKKFVAYMPATEAEKKRETKRDQGKPQYTTIEIPYSYAQLLAAHTYWTSVFLGRTPVFQFTGRHGEAEHKVQALEAIMDYQLQVGQMMIPLYIWLMDVGKYGIGVVGNYWEHEKSYVAQLVEVPKTWMGLPLPGTKQKVRQTMEMTSYLGNKLYNVRPFDWFPDPRVPVAQFQRGEFCGRYVEVGWNYVKQRGAQGIYQNVEHLKGTKPGMWLREGGSNPAVTLPNSGSGSEVAITTIPSTSDEDKLDYVSLLEMCVELIPNEWGLGSSNMPEKWMITIGNDTVILRCAPLGCLHNKFPFSVMEYEVEGYGIFKRGMMETLKPLNDVMTWLFNSHFHNVRKVLNDQLVIDPSRITMKDVTGPDAGRLIRLRPEAYGTNAKEAIHQLDVVDITRSHLTDANVVAEMMQRLSGVTDNIMGLVNAGGRKTATEVRTSSNFGINRLKTNAEFFSAGGFAPLSQMMVQNTQQYYDAQFKFKIAGDLLSNLPGYLEVTPDMIAGFFDFVPVDGTLPIDKFALANMWKELLLGMRQVPSLALQYDFGSIFGHIAHLSGVKNLQQFKLQVTPDQVLQAQVQAGNVVPLGGQSGRSSGRPAGGPVGSAGPRQVAGMGPTQ